jgi:NAD(P)H-hydrate repair Nnr-like enzyme with NAD(P)H-hydrate dehydratase domain
MGGVPVTIREAKAAVALAALLITAGLVWLFGPYGLIGAGVGVLLLALFVIDVKEQHGQAVATPSQPRDRHAAAVRVQ